LKCTDEWLAAQDRAREGLSWTGRVSLQANVTRGANAPGGYNPPRVLSRICGLPAGRGGRSMKDRIAVNPRIHFGKPCVAGTRILVRDVLELVREDIPFAQIIQDYYPDLLIEDIRACIQYAIDVVAVEDIHLASAP
jgi:uncharacterized protein (DUF433 family)